LNNEGVLVKEIDLRLSNKSLDSTERDENSTRGSSYVKKNGYLKSTTLNKNTPFSNNGKPVRVNTADNQNSQRIARRESKSSYAIERTPKIQTKK